MKRKILLALIFCLLTTSLAFANERRLQGQVLVLGEHNERVPARRNTEVVILQIQTSEYTDANGVFAYYLREKDKANKEIEFRVILDGYIVQDPLDGQTRIPKDSELDNLIRLLLVKQGSPYILSTARFYNSVEVANVKAKDQVKLGKDEQRVPIVLKVEEGATKLGFSEEAFRRWILEKAAELETNPNPKARARAAAAKGNFNKAGDLQMQATEQLAETYARTRPKKQRGPWLPIDQAIPRLVKDSSSPTAEDLEQLALELVKGFRFAGDAYYNAYQFEKATAAYTRALDYISKEDSPELWAAIQVDIGRAHAAIGEQTEGAAIHQNFEKAIGAFQNGLTIYTKEAMPENWAKTKDRLCNVLFQQAVRTSGQHSLGLLTKAIDACNDALTIYTKEKFPLKWAFTNMQLFKILRNRNMGIEGEADQQLIKEDTVIRQEVMPFLANELTPQLFFDYMQDNSVGQDQAGGEIGRRLIAEAITETLAGIGASSSIKSANEKQALSLVNKTIAAWQKTLTVYTKDQFPKEWAAIQFMIGWTLQLPPSKDIPEETRIQLITQALAAYQKALTVLTVEKDPLMFASAQVMRGIMLHEQGTRTEGKAGTLLFAQAVSAYHSALTIKPTDLPPQPRAGIQGVLGEALMNQGMRTTGDAGTRLLTEAIKSYEAALQVYTPMHFPKEWAEIHQKLAKAYLALENWQGVAESNSNVLIVDPDDKEAYGRALVAYHEKLFAYPKAFMLHQQWLDRHPNDLSAQANFAEAHFTTGRFTEAEARTAALLANPKLGSSSGLALRALYIATLLTANKPASVPSSLVALRDFVENLPSDFKTSWNFEGSRNFIGNEPTLAPSQTWLLELFAAVEEKDAQKRLSALENVQASFTTIMEQRP